MKFAAAQRIRGKSEFETIKKQGTKLYFGPFFAQYLFRDAEPQKARLGLVVSRKVGNAVIRNRTKRQLRELFRTAENPLPSNLDLIVIAKKTFRNHSFQEVKQSFEKLITQINQRTNPRN